MRTLAVSTLLALVAVPAHSLPDGHGGGAWIPGDAPDLSEAQRSEIWARLDANRAALEASGLLPVRETRAVLLDWPLAPAPGLNDPGYHGIANFIDEDPAYPNQILDYNCGDRSYDTSSGYNHQGTDFFTWPFGWLKMDNSLVQIVAAEPGVIIGKDDGNYDRSCSASGGNWNAVYIQHADGSIAWYGHMKNGSPTAKPVGASVVTGEYLGIVGSSGNSTGPHLHFELYDSASNLIDPWMGACNSTTATSWWTAQRPYYDSAVNHIATGVAAPDFGTCPAQETPNEQQSFQPGDTIYFLAYYHDQLAGQQSTYTIYRPDNTVFDTWTHSSPSAYFPASYWYWYDTNFAPAGPTGTWRFEVSFQGTTTVHTFTLGGQTPGPDDYVLGQGLGQPNPNQVVVYDGSGAPTAVSFLAYPAGQWGVGVAAGDVDGGNADIVTGPGPGPVFGPQVRGFQPGGAPLGKINFYAYATLKYGVNAALPNLDADPYSEILSGPGPGSVFGPHVRGWNFDGGTLSAISKISFFAYATLRYGVNVGGGDVDADGYDEILTAPGPGQMFGPQVRGWDYDGASVASIGKINFNAFATAQYGANVASGNPDADTFDEIVAAPGPGPALPSDVRGFDYDGAAIAAMPGFAVTPFATLYGGRAGVADVASTTGAELIAGAGRDPAASSLVTTYSYGGGALQQSPALFTPFPGAFYGVNVSGGPLGF
ncbi:MAG: M23 family metallopeptidase [Acidobacteriota bacterium]